MKTISLPQWLEKAGMNQPELASALGVAKSTISRVCSGKRRPSRELAAQIEGFTKGEVTAASFGWTVDLDGAVGPAILRKYVHDKRITVSEAARRAGVAAMSWRKWQDGSIVPSPRMLARLSRLLDTELTADDWKPRT